MIEILHPPIHVLYAITTITTTIVPSVLVYEVMQDFYDQQSDLDPKSSSNNSPKQLTRAQQALISHEILLGSRDVCSFHSRKLRLCCSVTTPCLGTWILKGSDHLKDDEAAQTPGRIQNKNPPKGSVIHTIGVLESRIGGVLYYIL